MQFILPMEGPLVGHPISEGPIEVAAKGNVHISKLLLVVDQSTEHLVPVPCPPDVWIPLEPGFVQQSDLLGGKFT